MDVSTRSTSTVNEDQTWIGNGGLPIGQPRSIVLDRSAFDLDTVFTEGHIPSGVGVGVVTATGMYAPYTPAATDGTETLAGYVFASIPVDSDSTGDLAAALFWSGEVIEANLPDADTTDAAGKADVANHIAFV